MKILLVDFGAYQVRFLYAEKKGKKFSVVKCDSIENTFVPTWDEIDSLERFTSLEKVDTSFVPDYVLFNINSIFLDNRFLILPFRDTKRVMATLPMELEDYVPFDMDEYLFDWRLIGGNKKLYKFFVLMLERRVLERYLDVLTASELNPDALYSDFDFFFTLVTDGGLYKYLTNKHQETEDDFTDKYVLFISIGKSKTDAIIFNGLQVVDAIVIPYAGDYITKTISYDYKIKSSEAEQRKLSSKILNTIEKDTAQDLINMSEVLVSALDIIIREVNQFVASFKATNKVYVDYLLTLGGTTKMEGLSEYMATELNMSLLDVDYPRLFTDKGINVSKKYLKLDNIPVLSLLLPFVEHRTWRGINFRKGKYSKEYKGEGFRELLRLFKPVIKSFVFVSLIFFLYAFVYNLFLSTALKSEENKVKQLITQVFFEKGPRTRDTLLEDTERLLYEIANKKKYYKKQTAKINGSMLDILNAISTASSGGIIIKELNITDGAVKIQEAVASTAELVQKFAHNLEDTKLFSEVNVGDIRIAADGVSKTFTLIAKFKKKGKR